MYELHRGDVLEEKVESVGVLQADEELVRPLEPICSYTFNAQFPPQASLILPVHGIKQFQAPVGVSGVR